MLLHAALSDQGPYGKRTRELAGKIERYLAAPARRGKVVRLLGLQKAVGATAKEMEILKVFIAQAWLVQNTDAPADAAAHYKDMLETELGKLDPDIRILISKTLENLPRQAFVSRSQAKTMVQKVTAPLTKEFVTVYEKREAQRSLVKASAKDEAIARIRDAYITAPIGATPAIPDLMVKLKFTDESGALLKGAPPDLSEAAVRERQLAEDWRGQRGKHVVRAFDIIPEEVKLVGVMRVVEAHRILFQHLKALDHIYTTYYKTGQMPATGEGGKALKLRPDPSVLASLAETMRRMFDGDGSKLSLTINTTTAASQAAQAEGAKADVQISQGTKELLARLSTMDQAAIEKEVQQMDLLRQLLANGGVTGEAASDQTIDVQAKEISVDKPAGS